MCGRKKADNSALNCLMCRQMQSMRGTGNTIHSVWQHSDEQQLSAFLRLQQAIKQEYEECRLLYVACTRARKRLYLSANIEVDDKGTIKSPSKSSLLARIWRQLEPRVERVPCSNGVEKTKEQQAEAPNPAINRCLLRLPVSWTPPVLGEPTLEQTNQGLDVFKAFDHAHQFQQHLGSLFHRILRRLTLDGLANWSEARLRSCYPFWLQQLRQYGCELDPGSLTTHLDFLTKTVISLQADPTAQWLFDHQHEHSACEYELLNEAGERHIIDRTFVTKDEKGSKVRWIIDYKTATPEKCQSLERFIATQKEEYAKQLQSYRLAMASKEQVDGLNYQTALYFPFIPFLAIY